MLSSLCPRCPLDSDMSLSTYTTCVKDVLDLGGKGVVQAKKYITHVIKIDHFARLCFFVHQLYEYILKAIKNATGTSVIFPTNISLIHFIFVLISVPNVGERFTKT